MGFPNALHRTYLNFNCGKPTSTPHKKTTGITEEDAFTNQRTAKPRVDSGNTGRDFLRMEANVVAKYLLEGGLVVQFCLLTG